jgi:transmembrane sensor
MKEMYYQLLMQKKVSGELTASEQAELDRWLQANPKHLQELQQLEKVYALAGQYTPPSFQPDVDAAWARFQTQIQQEQASTARPRTLVIPTWAWSAAAAVLVAIGVFVWRVQQPNLVEITASTDTTVTTLPDGSVATLNKNTQLRYEKNFNGSTRNVYLDGEAFFEVSPNKEKPFIVHSTQANVEVLGTSFNVRAIKNRPAEVFVRTGQVKFTPVLDGKPLTNSATLLLPNQKATWDKGLPSIQRSTDPNNLPIAWMTHQLDFKNVPLHQVVTTLESTYNVQIDLENQQLNACSCCNTTFQKAPIEEILQTIKTVFNMQLTQVGTSTWKLSGGDCK